jgi:hypothetical protein
VAAGEVEFRAAKTRTETFFAAGAHTRKVALPVPRSYFAPSLASSFGVGYEMAPPPEEEQAIQSRRALTATQGLNRLALMELSLQWGLRPHAA